MAMYRKVPVVVEARQVGTSPVDVYDLAEWCGGEVHTALGPDRKRLVVRIAILTLEGVMQARPGDWIIRGVAGEFYPCRADIFARTYEPAGGDA